MLLTFCSWPDATPRIALTGPGVLLGERRGEGDWWWPLGSVFDASMRWGGGRRETRLGWYRAWEGEEGVGLEGGGPMEVCGWEVGLGLSGDDRQVVATFDAGLLFLPFFAWVMDG